MNKLIIKSIFYIKIIVPLVLILVGCKEKKNYPEITQLLIRNGNFLNICRESVESSNIHNKSMDSTSKYYDENIINAFIVNIFEQKIEKETDTIFQIMMTKESDIDAKVNFYGYFILSDKPFFIYSTLNNDFVKIILEKMPYKKGFPFLYSTNSTEKNNSDCIIPFTDTKYRSYIYKNGDFKLIKEMY